MLHRQTLVVVLVLTCGFGVQAGDGQDNPERQKRRDDLRAALKARSEAAQDPVAPRPRTPQDRAELRAQLREQGREPSVRQPLEPGPIGP